MVICRLNTSVKEREMKLSLIYWGSVREQDGDTVRGRDCWLDLWLWQIWGSFHWAVPSCKFPVFVRAAIKTNPWPGQGRSFQQAWRNSSPDRLPVLSIQRKMTDRRILKCIHMYISTCLCTRFIVMLPDRMECDFTSYEVSESGGGTVRKSTLWWVPHVFICLASTSD